MKEIYLIINKLKEQYDSKYGYSIFFVEAHIEKNSLILSGKVLLQFQKNELESKVKSVFSGMVNNKIIVLSDLNSESPIGWGQIKSVPLDVFQYPPFCNSKPKVLSTQIYRANDVFRILYKKDGYYLIQLIDFTLGWVEQKKVRILDEDKKSVFDVLRPLKNELIQVSDGLKEKLYSLAIEYLDVKYLWGGTTKNGIDCSGFVQRLYRDVFGIVLPKNSKEQRKYGVRIVLPNIQFADIIFLRAKNKNISHVGIFLNQGVAHASLNQQKVVLESLNTVLDLYRFVGIRRYIDFR